MAFKSSIRTETTHVITQEMISLYKNRYLNPVLVYTSLFGHPPEGESDADNKLDLVYSSMEEEEDPKKLYEKYLDAVDFEYSVLNLDVEPMSFEDFMRDRMDGDSEAGEVDMDIISARIKLEQILNSPNTSKLAEDVKKQLNYGFLRDTDAIILEMYRYMNTIMPIELDTVKARFQTTDRILTILKDVRMILDEQLASFHEYGPCKMWYINSYHNETPYGSIIVYHNKTNYVMIQNIVKYPIPILVQLLFPEYNKYMPRLNSVLMDSINTVARDVDADYIYVHPLEEQAEQLEKHYGFHRTETIWDIPCQTISPTFTKKAYYREVEK